MIATPRDRNQQLVGPDRFFLFQLHELIIKVIGQYLDAVERPVE